MVGLLLFVVGPAVLNTHADELPNRQVRLVSSTAGEATTYKFHFNLTSEYTLGSIKLEFCANSALIDDTCQVPNGFNISSASLSSQSGETGFNIMAGTPANIIILGRTPSLISPGTLSYTFDNVVNPSVNGSYFVRVTTYASSDASDTIINGGGLAFAINGSIAITSTVPPYLLFCVGVTIQNEDCSTTSGGYVNFGELSPAQPKVGQTQLVIGTNAGSGYTLQVDGTTMASGINVIPALPTPDVSRPGTSQFGINLVENGDQSIGSNPVGPGAGVPTANYAQPNRYTFQSGDILVHTNNVENYRKFTTSYLINVSKNQAAGIYVGTMTYVCTASF